LQALLDDQGPGGMTITNQTLVVKAPCISVLAQSAGLAQSQNDASPLVVVECLQRFKLAALLAEPGQLAVDVEAEAAHVLLAHQEALVVWLLIPQQTLTALHLKPYACAQHA
jgi:hypothetical protein